MIVLDQTIRVPLEAANDFDTFRRWTKSDQYPERGDYAYLGGDLWIDLSMETILHNQIKGLFAIVIGGLAISENLGRFFGDRMRLVNLKAEISTEPDGMFVSHKSLRAKRVHWEEGPDSMEILGTPDLVLEVVSSHSVHKDTVVLRKLYALAGIPEYWLVNPLGGELEFQILRLTRKTYVPVQKAGGWLKSSVVGKSFRLIQEGIGQELPQLRLLVQ